MIALALYCALLLVGTLGGAAIPILWRPRAHQTDLFIAFSAGVLLGAAAFHLLPEAFHARGPRALIGVALGALTLWSLERYVLPHFAHDHDGVHALAHETPSEPALSHSLGLTAFFGLSLHTLSDGVALAAALASGLGTVVFTAIFAHQLPTSFSLAAILRRSGHSAVGTLLLCAAFALSVPVGALAYEAIATSLGSFELMPWALAFSAGNFLHLALSDLIPDLRHRGDRRVGLSLSLSCGVALMYGLRAFLRDV